MALKQNSKNRENPRKKSAGKKRRPRPYVPQLPNAIAFTLRGFQLLGGPGKSSVYELGKAGKLEVFKDPLGRTMITGKSGRAFLGIKEEQLA
jgi:hypothetical protein